MDIGLVNIGLLDWQRRPRQRRGPFARAARPAPLTKNTTSRFAFLPYAAGLLEAYVRQHAPDPSRYEFRLPAFQRATVEQHVAALAGVHVAGFSVYCWNFELSIAIARALKAQQPSTLIVFGGPHVPDAGAPFLEQYPFIDVAVHGEGETTFLSVLEAFEQEGFADVAGITSRDATGRAITTAKPPRIKDLDTIPSPYLTGALDRVIAAHPSLRWHALWETNRGCPFACTFCDWGSATASKVYQFSMDRVHQEIEWFASHAVEFIFGCDANFGILPRDVEIARLMKAEREKTGHPRFVGVQNTKNATERSYAVQKLIGDLSPNGTTISLQSVDPPTLKAIKRDNISTASFQELQRRYTGDGIDTYTDIIIGLPGETYDTYATGISNVIARGQHNRFQFYNCTILPNAEMARPEYRAQHGLKTVRSVVVEHHQPLGMPEGHVEEWEELVVATAAMPDADWVRAKAFQWMTDLLHCDRVLQIAFSALHATYDLDYRSMIEAVAGADRSRFPIAAGLHERFVSQAQAFQAGGIEYVPSEQWLGIYWPVQELALIELVTGYQIEAFYDEARQILGDLVRSRRGIVDARLLDEAVTLNQSLLRVPFEVDDLDLTLDYDVWECHRDLLMGLRRPAAARRSRYRITRTDPMWLDSEDWCEDVLSRFNRKTAFLYPIARLDVVTDADQTPLQARVFSAPGSAAAGAADRRTP